MNIESEGELKMINITMPTVDVVINKQDDQEKSNIYGFLESDLHSIPRDKGGVFTFYNEEDELLFVGKARKLRQRIKKHFNDNVSPIKDNRDEIAKIEVCIVDSPVDREIYETYMINELQAKYNVEKVFFK